MSTPTILIAHTNELTRDSIKEILANDFSLIVVETMPDVLPVLTSKTSVALLLLDANAVEENETSLFEDIRKAAPKLTIIALSDQAHEAHAIETVRQGANGYIFTPVKTDELRSIIEKAMPKIKS